MLNFQKRKKKYFDITLHDGTELQIPTPTMVVFDAMKEISENPSDVDSDQLKDLLSTILSTNRAGLEITGEHLKEFDSNDIKDFFLEYVKFVQGVLSDPNLKSPIVR